jgi:hypothetical protein
MVALASETLDQLLDPLTACFTPEVADRIGRLQLDGKVRTKLADFAERSSLGTLSSAEQAEYQELVELLDLIGIVQAKARRVAVHRGA